MAGVCLEYKMATKFEGEWLEFWKQYPRKVGKLSAQKAYMSARQKGASAQDLLTGIARYIQGKPAYADWAHASTWIRAGRWMDEYGAPTPAQPAPKRIPAAY
jgi:hypothetical protein